MNSDIGSGLVAIGGLIITVAIVSVIVGHNSKAPGLVQATGSALGNVIAAAVNPVGNAANNGNNNSTFSSPAAVGASVLSTAASLLAI